MKTALIIASIAIAINVASVITSRYLVKVLPDRIALQIDADLRGPARIEAFNLILETSLLARFCRLFYLSAHWYRYPLYAVYCRVIGGQP